MRMLTRCTPSQYVSRFFLVCIVHLDASHNHIVRTELPKVRGSGCSPLTSTVNMHLQCFFPHSQYAAVTARQPPFNAPVLDTADSLPHYDVRAVTGTITVCDAPYGTARPRKYVTHSTASALTSTCTLSGVGSNLRQHTRTTL